MSSMQSASTDKPMVGTPISVPCEGVWIEMRDRLRLVVGDRSSEEIGRLTGISGESVRRYLMGHVPSARFLATLCQHDRLNGTWLLTGQGEPTIGATGTVSLHAISTDVLMAELGKRLDQLSKVTVASPRSPE